MSWWPFGSSKSVPAPGSSPAGGSPPSSPPVSSNSGISLAGKVTYGAVNPPVVKPGFTRSVKGTDALSQLAAGSGLATPTRGGARRQRSGARKRKTHRRRRITRRR